MQAGQIATAAALFLLAAASQAQAQVQTVCEQRLPQAPYDHDAILVDLRMSLDDAHRVLTYKGFKQLVPRGDDAGFTYERMRDKRRELVLVASFTAERCVDYIASTSEFQGPPPPKPDPSRRMRTQQHPADKATWLSRFQALGSAMTHRPETSCIVSFNTVLTDRSLNEQINLCALLPAQRP